MNEELQLSKLGIADLENVLALQEKNLAHFKPEERHFTVHRTKEDFIQALTADNQFMYGVYVGKSLVAQSILEFPKDGETTDVQEYTKGYKNSDVAIYRAVLVDPDYRGRGLMMRMLQAREDMAIMSGKKLAVCKVSADNSFSWTNVLKHGMQISKVYEDKKDGHMKLFLQKSLCSAPNKFLDFKNKILMKFNANGTILTHKMNVINQMGKIGIWDKQENALAWVDKYSINSHVNNNFKIEQFHKLKMAR